MEREHVMILLDADMRTVHARLARKFNAGVAEMDMHPIRTGNDGDSNSSTSPSLYERVVQASKTIDDDMRNDRLHSFEEAFGESE